jgi:fructan beta-fructosidase
MNHTRCIPACCLVAAILFLTATAMAADDIVIADFKKDPLPAGWQVEGYAFGSRAAGPERQQAAKTTANQRQYQTGKLTSPEFTIERGYLVMELGGTYHPEKCCVALVVDGRDVRRVSPGEVGNPSPSSMDVRELLGKKARIEARDDHFNGWVELGRVFQADKPRGGAQEEIPAWEPTVFQTKIDGAFLLLPLDAEAAPLQTVTIEIDGQEKLAADMPLAMRDAANYQPVYGLTGDQGKMLRVSYHQTADSQTKQLIRLSPDIPKHEAVDSKPAFHVHCRFGRLNDPNGLVYHDGQYHLFHQ